MCKSLLFDEKTFYATFLADLEHAKHEVIIESPFITTERMNSLWPSLVRLVNRGVEVYIVTRDPLEHSDGYEVQSEFEIQRLEANGVHVFICVGNHHRKLAILDRRVLWEGSLNILSQITSREIMRRIDSKDSALECFEFIGYSKYISSSKFG